MRDAAGPWLNKLFWFWVIFSIYIFIAPRLEKNIEFFYNYFQPREKVDIYFLNVGQGDATLFYTTDRQVILVDGGPDLSVLYEIGRVLPFYEKTIDLLVLTHPDSDHLNGLVETAQRYKIKNFLFTGVVDDLPAYDLLLDQLHKTNTKIFIAQAGQIFTYDSLQIEVIYPLVSLQHKVFSDTNASSLALTASFGRIDFILTGDLPGEQERELIALYPKLSAEIIKAGHHGSQTSTYPEFLQVVKPQYVIISAGLDNRYGHPHFRVLYNIKNVQAQVLRTDQLGTIWLQTDGQKVEIK